MVVQAIALLDDLDKEINIYAMRVKVSRVFLRPWTAFQTLALGMVRLALPRNGQDHHGQHRVRDLPPHPVATRTHARLRQECVRGSVGPGLAAVDWDRGRGVRGESGHEGAPAAWGEG